MRTVLSVLFVLGVCTSAFAQTVPASQPFNVLFDHPGTNVTAFRCVLDGKPLVPDLAITSRSCPIPGLAPGQHSVTVQAINATLSASSQPLGVTVPAPPVQPEAPNNLRIEVIVTVQKDGSVTLLAASASKQ